MRDSLRIARIALVCLLLGACSSDDETTASADIAPTTGRTVTGTATFTVLEAGGASISVEVADAPEGMHGFHIHETPDCGMDGMNAGDHWNPDGEDHGMPGQDPSHLGDLGNFTVAADGTGTLTAANPTWTIGDGATTDVVGHAVIVHADPDDFSQPLGNAGARIGCGIIELD
jgi:superoxide dismutase, Cu-Zn family